MTKEEKNNNGWIKIESEDDLPKDYTECHIIIKNVSFFVTGYYEPITKKFYIPGDYLNTDKVTHYQPYPKPPIY